MQRETVDISGMGGGYEAECQRMLWRGVAYLHEIKPPLEMWKGATSYAGVYGVLSTDGADLKALEATVIPSGTDCTGAMHQAVMSHLCRIHEYGIDWWLAKVRERDPVRLYVVDTETGEAVGVPR
jgi:hypothetical protein